MCSSPVGIGSDAGNGKRILTSICHGGTAGFRSYLRGVGVLRSLPCARVSLRLGSGKVKDVTDVWIYQPARL